MEVQREDGYGISSDKSLLNVEYVHVYLAQQSYWAQGRSRPVLETAMANSLCFGVYLEGVQVGFARVVTDYAIFAYLCDLFVDPAHQGRGLGKWLVKTIVSAPDLATVRRVLLVTRDAHELYRRYGGFEALATPEDWLVRVAPQ